MSVTMTVNRWDGTTCRRVEASVAAEVPCTVIANGVEVATMLCSPDDLDALAAGFLLSGGMVRAGSEISDLHVDTTRWTVTCTLRRTPDPALMKRRLYTSGCGRGVMFNSLAESVDRHPLSNELRVRVGQVRSLAAWLQRCSKLYRDTHGVHTAALSIDGAEPAVTMDDIGRHNAVDKVIGRALLDSVDLERAVLVSSGRVSSEILHKARAARIAVVIARGAPTHQTVLRARQAGVTVVGLARGGACTVYAHEERIVSGEDAP